MMINATLIMQIIHFFIACYAIDKILLRKIVAIIKADQSKNKLIDQAIEFKSKELSQLEKKKNDRWMQLRDLFFTKETSFQPVSASYQELILTAPAFDEKKALQMKDDIARIIVKRIGAVDDFH